MRSGRRSSTCCSTWCENRERVVSKDDLLDAVWGGRIVSESTLTSHINAVRKAIGDSGEEQRLIRTVARKGFRFVGDVREVQASDGVGSPKTEPAASNEASAPALTLPDRPSIAVLPFQNLSGDPEQEYFADGMVEDIITALSRIRWLFVIARNSSFTYKGRAVDVKQVGRELGVRYVLEGSVRKAANRVRITGQLIDATTGAHLWADRFDGTLDDIFELQDQVAASVVGAIAPQLERAEIERAKRKPTESLDAYDYYLRGMANLHQGTREAIDEALPLFHKAIELDPDFASAYGDGGVVLLLAQGQRLDDRSRAGDRRGRAIGPARRRAGQGRCGRAHARRPCARAISPATSMAASHLLDRALVLNPNLAAAWFLGGFLRIWRGEPDDAIEHFARAMRLSPLDPEMYRMQAGMAMAHLFAGRFDAASSWAEKAFRDLPSFLMVVGIIAASHALAGRMDEARRAMRPSAPARSRRCASPISRTGSRSTGRKISPRSRTACEEQGCRNDRTIGRYVDIARPSSPCLALTCRRSGQEGGEARNGLTAEDEKHEPSAPALQQSILKPP